MKERTKKLSALLLAAAMTASLAACGGAETADSQPVEEQVSGETKEAASTAEPAADAEEELYYNKEGFPIVKEPITIEVAGWQDTTLDWEKTHVVKKIEEEMGIKIKATGYKDSAAWDTQYATMLATDTLPDLVWCGSFSKATINENGEEGYLLDLSDYLEIMPNFAKFLEENPEYAAYHTTEDGSIYSIDRVRSTALPQSGLYVSKADQEKYGFSVEDIKTVEDFYNVLKSIEEQNPDVIPLSFTFDKECAQRAMWGIRTAFGIYSCDHNVLYGVDDQNQVILYDITENNKAYLQYMNRLWEEDLLDHDAFIMTGDEFSSKVRNGEVVFWHDWSYLSSGLAADMSVWEEYDCLAAMTSEYNEVPTYVTAPPYNSSARVYVSASTDYPEAICRLIDYTFTEEGQTFFNWGTEGETYELVDDGLGNMIPNIDNFWDQENYATKDEWKMQEVMCVNALNCIIPMQSREIVAAATDEELEKMIFEDDNYTYTADAHLELAIRKQADVVRYPSYLPAVLNADENGAISQPLTDMKLLIEQYKAQFVSGELDIANEWDSYVEQISGFWNQVQPVVQGAYDRIH